MIYWFYGLSTRYIGDGVENNQIRENGNVNLRNFKA